MQIYKITAKKAQEDLIILYSYLKQVTIMQFCVHKSKPQNHFESNTFIFFHNFISTNLAQFVYFCYLCTRIT